MNSAPILLASDLDRTLIPNDVFPESPQAKPRFRKLCQSEAIRLVYVSGRSQAQMKEAIRVYDLPEPNFAITDVGSSLFACHSGFWSPMDEWFQTHQASGWTSRTHHELSNLDGQLRFRLQKQENQTPYKVSFVWDLNQSIDQLKQHVKNVLRELGLKANLIWSEDPLTHEGLLDILPPSADKLRSLLFLGNLLQIPTTRMFFAGDSGNDLAVLSSPIPSVLVANAADEIKGEALSLAKKNQNEKWLYLATGNFQQMNGNYVGGILEGFSHFFPFTFKEVLET